MWLHIDLHRSSTFTFEQSGDDSVVGIPPSSASGERRMSRGVPSSIDWSASASSTLPVQLPPTQPMTSRFGRMMALKPGLPGCGGRVVYDRGQCEGLPRAFELQVQLSGQHIGQDPSLGSSRTLALPDASRPGPPRGGGAPPHSARVTLERLLETVQLLRVSTSMRTPGSLTGTSTRSAVWPGKLLGIRCRPGRSQFGQHRPIE